MPIYLSISHGIQDQLLINSVLGSPPPLPSRLTHRPLYEYHTMGHRRFSAMSLIRDLQICCILFLAKLILLGIYLIYLKSLLILKKPVEISLEMFQM